MDIIICSLAYDIMYMENYNMNIYYLQTDFEMTILNSVHIHTISNMYVSITEQDSIKFYLFFELKGGKKWNTSISSTTAHTILSCQK